DIRIFIGFANYYRRFIQYFSRIAAPLNRLTERKGDIAKGGQKQRNKESVKINLPPEAKQSFLKLK
ncbi:uncharacterized protein SEPMUDRAFT_49341, partial [Sphaerulina musiva SO2202]